VRHPVLTWVLVLSSMTFAAWGQDAPLEEAAESPTPGVLLEEVLCVTTRSKSPSRLLPSSVSVLKREEIVGAPARNVDALLRALPGRDGKRTTGFGSGIPTRMSVRGVPGANRTLMLVDGVPVNAAGTGFMGTNDISLEAAERVEVVRGPFSSLYGSNALGGVVQVLTRDPSEPWSGSLFNAAGTGGYENASASLSGTEGPLGVFVQADRRLCDNYLVRDWRIHRVWSAASGSFETTTMPVTNYGYEEERAFGKVVLRLSPGTRVTLHGQAFRGHLGYGQTQYLKSPQDVSLANHAALGALRMEARLSDSLDLSLGGYGRRRHERVVNESFDRMNPAPPFPIYVATFTDTVYRDAQGEARVSWRPAAAHHLVLGVDHLENKGRFTPARWVADGTTLHSLPTNERGFEDTGFYLQEEWELGPLRLVPGARFDHNSVTGWETSPKMGVLWNPGRGWRARSSVGTAFRTPTLAELFMPDVSSIPGVLLKSNPDLRTEYLTAWDAGFEKDWGTSWTLGGDMFVNRLRDLIAMARAGGSMSYVNVDRAWSRGFNESLTWRVGKAVRCSVNHTAQWAEDRSTHARLDYMPRNKGNVMASGSLVWGDWVWENQGRWFLTGSRTTIDSQTGRRYRLSGYATLDFSTRWVWKKRARLELKVLNLTDARYEETGDILAPSRQFQVGAGVDF